MNMTQEMLTTFNDGTDLLKKVITGDESWTYDHEIETTAHSFHFATTQKIKENL